MIFSSCKTETNVDFKIFAEQIALPIDVIGGTHRSFILLDDGSLWSFGWIDDGRGQRDSMVYAQIPFFVMDDVAEIFTQGGSVFATTKNGNAEEIAWHRAGFELTFTEDEIWASGEFLQGHLARHEMVYLTLAQPTKVWSADEGFVPNQQILLGNWRVSLSSDESLNPPTNLDTFGYTFLDNGTRFMSNVFSDLDAGINRWSPILDSEQQWAIMQDGRLKIESAGSYEIFDLNLSRIQNSSGIFDWLVLSNGDFYKMLGRSR